METPTLNQISYLKDTLKEDEMVKVQFETNTLFGALDKTSLKEFNLIKWLYSHKKSLALRNKLIDIGVKPKKQ